MRGIAARHRHEPALGELGDLPVTHLPVPRPVLYEMWHRFRRPSFARRLGDADVVHATGGVMPPTDAPLVATVHDLAFLHAPEFFTPRGVRFMTTGFEIARDEAALIAVPSEATAADCEAHGVERDRIRVVPWGADRVEVSAAERARVADAYDLPPVFVLFVGTREPRKNLRRLLEAHAAATPDVPLLVAGPTGWGDEVGVGASAVRNLGHVPQADLVVLLDRAAALVYPSLIEGFGMPVLEAMAQGTAAITSGTTATAEVAGDTGLLVDPTDTVDIGEALASVRDDPADWEHRGRLAAERAARFTWAATAASLESVYDEVVG